MVGKFSSRCVCKHQVPGNSTRVPFVSRDVVFPLRAQLAVEANISIVLLMGLSIVKSAIGCLVFLACFLLSEFKICAIHN